MMRFKLESIYSPVAARTVLAFALAMAGCAGDPSAPVDGGTTPRTARAVAWDMSVTKAAPDSATQDTTLDVAITGTGFVAGTTASWTIAGGQDPLQVRTNSTRFVSSRQLIANITISRGASIGKWDIVVTAAGKKGGIGTESFTIRQKPNPDTNPRANYIVLPYTNVAAPGQPSQRVMSGLQGDGRLKDGVDAYGADSEYQGDFCGANGIIHTVFTSQASASGDINLAPDGMHGGYCGAPRTYRFFFGGPAGSPTMAAAATRLSALWGMKSGEVVSRVAEFHVHTSGCTKLVYDSGVAGSGPRDQCWNSIRPKR